MNLFMRVPVKRYLENPLDIASSAQDCHDEVYQAMVVRRKSQTKTRQE